jgi:hypothetical protein
VGPHGEQQASIGPASAQSFKHRGRDKCAAVFPAPALRQGIPNDAEFGRSTPGGMIESLRPPSRKMFLGEVPCALDVLRNLDRPVKSIACSVSSFGPIFVQKIARLPRLTGSTLCRQYDINEKYNPTSEGHR